MLFVRSGGLSYYKRGRFRELGSVAPVEVASHCSMYTQTVRGALLCIGDNGSGCATELDIYKCVDDVYAMVENVFGAMAK